MSYYNNTTLIMKTFTKKIIVYNNNIKDLANFTSIIFNNGYWKYYNWDNLRTSIPICNVTNHCLTIQGRFLKIIYEYKITLFADIDLNL